MNWKKIHSKLGTAEQGSAGVAALAAVLALGGATMYVQNSSQQLKQSVEQAKVEAKYAQVITDNMNQAARYKALYAQRKMDVPKDGTTAGGPKTTRNIPSIAAEDYYAPKWNLVRNKWDPKVQNLDLNNGVVKFSASGDFQGEKGRTARLAKLNDLDYYNQIFDGKKSATDLAAPARQFEFVGHKFKQGAYPQIASVYVRVKSDVANESPVVVEIPVPPPALENVELQYSHNGVNWTPVTTTNLTLPSLGNGAKYQVRLVADGVVQNGWLTNGSETKTFEIDQKTGKPNHGAVSVLSTGTVLGTVDVNLVHTKASESAACKFTDESVAGVVIGYYVEGIGTAVDKVKVGTHVTFNFTAAAGSKDISVADVKNQCNAQCPYFTEETFENGLRDRWIATNYKGSYTQDLLLEQDRKTWNQMDKKLCINAEKAAVAYNKYSGRPKLQFHYELNDENLPYRDLREMYTYDIPSCKEEFLFARGKCGCFAEKTNILMGDGKTEKAIEDLTSEDQVWNPILKKSMGIKRMTRGPENVAMLEIAVGGQVLSVTGKHPFPTESGIRAAFELEPKERILLEDGTWSTIESITASNEALGKDVWNLELDGPTADLDHHYVVANGVITGDLLIQENLQRK